ncbi:MAG: hypothetical protein NTY46_09380 [Candidatus Sumerlaeota bacterium]|nr:hypothetical protein [Candidatus Sumerlaeota bacterium]
MGLPWDTPQALEDNIRFAREQRPDFVEIFYTYPFPGTRLHEIAVENGLLGRDEISTGAYSHPAMGGLYMARDELDLWRRKSLRRICLDPRYVWRTLRGALSAAQSAA